MRRRLAASSCTEFWQQDRELSLSSQARAMDLLDGEADRETWSWRCVYDEVK